MSVVIRLARMGKRGERKFRIVVSEKRSRRDGEPIETLGSFEKGSASRLASRRSGQGGGRTNPSNLKKNRYNYWLSKGARPSAAVAQIFEG